MLYITHHAIFWTKNRMRNFEPEQLTFAPNNSIAQSGNQMVYSLKRIFDPHVYIYLEA